MKGRLVRFAFTQKRHVDAHVICAAERLLELDISDRRFLLLDSARVTQIHQLLDSSNIAVVMISRVIAKNIHVEARAFLDHGQPDSSRADDGDRLARHLVAEKRQERMPRRPGLFANETLALPHFASKHPHHEECELGGRFGQNVRCVRERDPVFVRVSPVDVIETDRDLGDDL